MRKFLLSTIALLVSVVMMAAGLNNGADKDNAIEFVWGNESNYQVGTSALWYHVDLNQLNSVENPMIEFTLNLPAASSVAVTAKVEFDVPFLGTQSLDFSRSIAGKDTMNFSMPVGDLLKLRVNDVYVLLQADKTLDVSADYFEGTEVIADNCENAINFNWNMIGVHEAGTSAWYKFDVSEVLKNKEHVYLTFTNHSDQLGWVMGELRHTCSGEAISVVCPVPAGMSVTKVIDYSFLEASPVEQFYFHLLMTDVTISLKAETGSALADAGVCDNIIEVESGKTYEHAAGTQWYKFTGNLFENEGLFSRVRLVNRSTETVTITSGMTIDCQYTAATQVSFKLPARFDLAFHVPTWVMDQLKKVVDSDVHEIYMPITTNQPIAFSFGVEACETAIPFDWTTGHTQEAWTTQWYEVDIASVKANKQQVKLTFTNHSNTLAWVGSLVSLDCPYYVAMPLVFPIPAGMSVDKVIDYSYFAATKLDHLYVGVTTEEKISVKAEAQTAIANPNNQLACANAVEVKSGEVYENTGTQWYKLTSDLFNNMSRLPRFRVATPEGKTSLTIGGTVDCEYNIATRATLPLPGNMDLSFRFPSFVFDVIRKLVNPEVTEFYLEMTTDKLVEWSIDMTYVDACETAIELDLSQPITLDLKANEDVWYKVDLNTIIALKDKNIEFGVYNNNDNAVEVEVEVSPTCPVIVSATKTKSLNANDSLVYSIPTSQIASIHDRLLDAYPILKGVSDNLVYYVRVRANGDLTIDTDTVTPEPAPEGCENAILLDWTKTINMSDLQTGWYKFDISSLHGTDKAFTLSLNNDLGEKKNLGFMLYKDCDTYVFGPLVMSFPVGVTERSIPSTVLSLVSDIDMLYVYLEMDANLPCEDAILFDWNKGAYQEADKTQWYEFDITPVLEQEKQVKLTFTNHSDENAWVIAELALNCPYTKSIPMIVPVPAGMSVDKWIDYSVFEASRIEHFYLGVTTKEAAIELAATWEDARVAPSDGCLNATLVQTDSLYEHAAGTHWYKLTGDLFEGEGMFSRVHLINRSTQTVNITAGGTVGCEYNIATRAMFKLPKYFDLAFAIPVWVVEQMKKFVDDDVKEFYMELTTDQPIAFSFGMERCEESILFDWTTGHTQGALTNQWYEVDITPVLANEQQIKLTLTNHSNETAWVTTLVSLDCPFKVALPLAFPIPAGMSVDKVIDYSYFAATRLDHIYVGVSTTETISVKAEAQNAVVTPTDDCINATEILSGSTYVHNGGTSWYKVDGSLFADMGKLPKFQFATVSGKKTNITFGATVGCEYNIATRATLPVPGDVEVALRVPSFIFKAARKFIDYDVNEFYIELTTDEQIEFSIDATVEEDLDACLDAVDLIVSDSMTIDLVANTDTWYKVDMSAVKNLNKDLAITVSNAAQETVEVEVEVSPTCPIAATILKRFTAPAATTATTVLTAAQINELLKEYPNLIYYVRVRTTGNLHIEVSEPEIIEKEACEEAIDYVWGTPTTVVADSDVWYAIDITDAKASSKDLFVTVKNIDDIAAVVLAEVLYDCPGTVQHSLTKTIGVGESLSTTIAASEIQGVESNVLYLHLVTTGDIEVTVGEPEIIEDEDACLTAIPLNWNEEVTVIAGDTMWYAVNIADAKVKQKDIKLTVKNESTESALVTADIAYDCPVTTFVHSFTKNIAGNMSISTTVSYSEFETLETDILYIRIITTGDLRISATIVEDPVIEETTCEDAIAYTLGTVVTLPANADVWYAIDITTAKANKSDLELIVNNESDKANEVEVKMAEECPVVDFLLEMSMVVDPLSTMTETTTYETYSDYADVIYLHIKTQDVLNFVLSEVRTKVYETKTVEELICDGTEYVDPITNEKHIISSLISSTQTWSDTVVVSEWLDSVYVFVITPIVAPVVMDEALLATIPNATPVLKPGLMPDVTGTLEAITEYYASIDTDTVADIDSIYWTEASLNTIVDCEATSYTMTLVVEAGCDNVITSELVFEVVQSSMPDVIEDITVCYGETYTWNGNVYDQTGKYTITLSNAMGCDSIVTLNLTVLPEVAETIVNATVCAGETYVWDANGNSYTTSTTDTIVMQNIAGCDSVVILQLTVLPAIEETTEVVVICNGETYLWNETEYDATGIYTITLPSVLTGCDSVAKLDLTVLPAAEYVKDSVVLCYGETYTWAANGKTYDRTTTATYKKKNQLGCDSVVYTLDLTIRPAVAETIESATICYGQTYAWNNNNYNATGSYSVTLSDVNGCDSVVTLNLTVLPDVYEVTNDTLVCNGESFTWFGQTCNEAKAYTHVIKNVLGCDSVIYTLNVSMLPAAYEVTSDTLVCNGESFTWNGQTCDEAKAYTHVVKNVLGCDSVIYTLNVSMLPAAYEVENDTTICYGESFTWNGQTCDATKAYTHVVKNVLGCDSITYTLHVTVLPDVVTENEELVICESEFPYEWRGEVINAAGVYTVVEQYTATGCDSVIHTLNLQTYVMTLPAVIAEPVAVCGNPVDVVLATDDITLHIESTNMYAPNAIVTWYVKDGNTWTELTDEPIQGGIDVVVLKYVISSDCGSIESEEIEVVVEAPRPDNDADMDNVLAISKYENRVFLLHLNDFTAKYGWTPTPEEVTWYKVVNLVDTYGGTIDDEKVGTGHYYNEPDGSIIKPGEYYALIIRQEVAAGECETTMRSVVLTSGVVALTPQVVPNVARPDENLRIINLNPEEVTEIRVYSTSGELIDTYVADQVAEFMFNAAHTSGYYMVDVETANGKTTLRYVVK